MPFPASLQTITLTGDFRDGADDGNPREGTVTITLPTPIRSQGDNVIIPPFEVVEEMADGTFSIALPATTDPDWLPNTASYIVQAVFPDGWRKLWWQFPLPFDTAGGTLDLADVGEPNVGTPSLTVRQGTSQPLADGGYKGTWGAGTLYRTGDTVQHDSAVYGALKPSTGVTPGTNAEVWKVYPGAVAGVTSVFGRTGAIIAQSGDYTKAQVGLANVDNTSDADKPVSTAQATAIAGRQPLNGDLTTIAGLTPSNDDLIQRKSGLWVNRSLAQVATDIQGSLTVGQPQVTGLTAALAAKADLSGGVIPIAQIPALATGGYRGDWAPGTAYRAGDIVTYGDAVWGCASGAAADVAPYTSVLLYNGVPTSTDTTDGVDYQFRARVTVDAVTWVDGLRFYKTATQTNIPHEMRIYDSGLSTTSPILSVTVPGETGAGVGYQTAPVLADLRPGRTYEITLVTGAGTDAGYGYTAAFGFPVDSGPVHMTAGGFTASHANITAVTNPTTHYAGVNLRYRQIHASWRLLYRHDAVVAGTSRALSLTSVPA